MTVHAFLFLFDQTWRWRKITMKSAVEQRALLLNLMNWAFPPTFGAQQRGALECWGVPLVQGAEKFFDASGLRSCTFQGMFGWKWSRAISKTCSFTLIEHSFCLCNRAASAALVPTGMHNPPPESHCIGLDHSTPASQVDLKVRDMTKQRGHGAAWAWWGQAKW